MIDIIKVELFRLKKSVLFWVMLALAAASPLISVLMNALLYAILGVAGEMDLNVFDALREAGVSSALLQQMTNVSGDVTMWAIIATAVILSKEFVDGTMRNVMLANKSRTELYFGYFITAMIVSVTYMTAFLAVTLIIIAPIFGFQGAGAGKVVSAIFCSYGLGILAAAFVESCVCMFIFSVRKQWAAILFPLLIWYAPAAFASILSIVVNSMIQMGQLASVEFLRWIPFVNMQQYNPLNMDGAVIGMNVLYLAVFIAAFTCIGFFTFKKADLK